MTFKQIQNGLIAGKKYKYKNWKDNSNFIFTDKNREPKEYGKSGQVVIWLNYGDNQVNMLAFALVNQYYYTDLDLWEEVI